MNYPVNLSYQRESCSESLTMEISYNKLLNSSAKFIDFDPYGCLFERNDSVVPFMELYILGNLKWLQNWGSAFSKKNLEKVKYGSLYENDEIYEITLLNKKYKTQNKMFVRKDSYAIESVHLEKPEKLEKNLYGIDSCGFGFIDLNYKKEEKYHLDEINFRCVNGEEINFSFGEPKKLRKLKKDKYGANLIWIIGLEKQEFFEEHGITPKSEN